MCPIYSTSCLLDCEKNHHPKPNHKESINSSRSRFHHPVAEMNNEFDHHVPLPDFRTISQCHAKVSEAHTSLSQEMGLLRNIPAIEQGAAILQQLTEMNNNFNHRFTALENRITAIEARFTHRFTALENRITAIEARFTHRFTALENRITAIEARFTHRFTALENRITAIEARFTHRFTALENRITAIEARFTARFTELNDHLISIENKMNTK